MNFNHLYRSSPKKVKKYVTKQMWNLKSFQTWLCSPKGFNWNATLQWTGLLINHLLSSGLNWDLWRWGGAPTHQQPRTPSPPLQPQSQQMVQTDSSSPPPLGQAASFSVRGNLLLYSTPRHRWWRDYDEGGFLLFWVAECAC